MGLIFFRFGHPGAGPSDPVGPFNFTIRMGPRKVGAIRWVTVVSVWPSAWTSDGLLTRPSGGPFQLSPAGPPEGGSRPVGLNYPDGWPYGGPF